MSSLILHWHDFGPFPVVLTLDPRENSPAPPSPHSLLRKLKKAMLLSLHFSEGKAQSPQLLLVGRAFQPFTRRFTLLSPPLDMFEDLHIFLQCWGPALHTVLHVRLQQCWLLGDNPFSGPAGHAMCVSSMQFALSAAWAHCSLLLSLLPICTPRSLSACQPLLSQFRLVSSVTPSQPQKTALRLLPFHAWDSPMLQSIKILLWGLLFLKKVNSTSQFGIFSKLPKEEPSEKVSNPRHSFSYSQTTHSSSNDPAHIGNVKCCLTLMWKAPNCSVKWKVTLMALKSPTTDFLHTNQTSHLLWWPEETHVE